MGTESSIQELRDVSEEVYSDAYMYSLISRSRKHAWVVAAPKSGSTWLTALLAKTLGWPQSALVPCYGRREQEADPRQLMFHPKEENLLSIQQHCRFSQATLALIDKANIDVVLQVRDIFDTVVSLRDHLTRESTEFPMAWMNGSNWKELNDTQKADFVIDMVVPWYFNFFVGWMQSGLVETGKVFVCTYERLRENPVAELQKILRFLREERDPRFIQTVVDGTQEETTRFNKGVVGRGKSLLSEAQQERITRYGVYYSGVDLSLLGICQSKQPSKALPRTAPARCAAADGRRLEDLAVVTQVPGMSAPAPPQGLRLDLGCGLSRHPGFIGVDRFPLTGVDVVLDLDRPLPFADDSTKMVLASHSLEHVHDLISTMREIYRICKHGAQVCIVAPYFHQGLNLANAYHLQCFNEHTPRFWTSSPTTPVDSVEYAHPHARSWGLAESDHSHPGIDFRCLRMEFFYFPEYRHLSPDQQRAARNKHLNVCDQILYHLLVVKGPAKDEEVQELTKHMEYYEPACVAYRKAEERFEEKLREMEASLEAANAKLAAAQAEIDQMRSSLESARLQSARQRSMAQELDSFRHRRITRLVQRFRGESDLYHDLAAPFQQLKDDSQLFGPGLKGYRLQPSVGLHRVPFLQYPLCLGRPNLAGVSLATNMDLTPESGVLGIEIVSPANEIVVQEVVPARGIDPSVPTRIDFPPIADSHQGRFRLRVFVREVDVPVRVLEWRKYSCLGLGRLQTRAFCGFHFDDES